MRMSDWSSDVCSSDRAGCEIRGCCETRKLYPAAKPATDSDWDTEFLDAIIAVRIVDGVGGAIRHVNRHGSHHTDAIITGDTAAAPRFLAEIASGIVLHHPSPPFADGGASGMGPQLGERQSGGEGKG